VTAADDVARFPIPEELASLPRDSAAVIEASAGTGKTFLIEHLVVDRLIAGDARLDEILVVTFTERAAGELLRRLRSLIERARTARGDGGIAASAHAWTIDAAARARLDAAERTLDLASISTIHGFCRRVLVEHAFAGGRLLAQQNVESRSTFAGAFAEVLRRRLATDPELAPYLEAWLAAGNRLDGFRGLEPLLYQARQLRCDWGDALDPERLEAAGAAFLALPAAATDAEVRRAIGHAGSAKSVVKRLADLRTTVAAFLERRDVPRFLAEIDVLVVDGDVFAYVEERLDARHPAIAELRERLGALADAAVPLATAVAQRLGPAVSERLDARKRAAGLYDFDDMLGLVSAALRGPGGEALAATLRGRYRMAVIDEFQDTDPVQWEIFRAIFRHRDDPRPLYLVGDPKQSIYGFRGADVSTYFAACAEVAPTDATHRLGRNFRSSPAVVRAYNAILDQDDDPPFFTTGPIYRPPVVAAREADARDHGTPPLALLRVTTDEDVKRLPMRAVRAALTRAIADEIAVLLRQSDAPPAREIFVLTRTRRESEDVARALAARGLPHVLYNQEGLYETDEARHVRDLLRAIADPHDPERRLRAYLTPFFGLSLADLPEAALPDGDRPTGTGPSPFEALYDRLLAWHAAAQSGELGRLYARILDDSGVIRRELFGGENARRLTNYLHLFELLASEAARAPRPLEDVARRLSALVAKVVIPAPEEGNVLRVEAARDAVQIMTMHRAKGLEADVVFVYGGFSGAPTNTVRTYEAAGRRVGLAGRPRREAITEAIKREREGEDQRLYYVALTRARRRLYLPFSPNVRYGDEETTREEYWRINGGYRHVNQRLRVLTGVVEGAKYHDGLADGERLYSVADVQVNSRVGDEELAAYDAAALAAWQPDPAVFDGEADASADELAGLRRRHAGVALTSYSRIKQAHGGYRPPTEISDELADAGAATATAPDDPADDLPGGARSGIYLHALLEAVPVASVVESPQLDSWMARPDVAALLDATGRRHGRDPRHARAAARLVHAGLTARFPVVGGVLDGVARAPRLAREMEFLFPFPTEAGGADRGFVRGFVDFIFEHEGRTYFGDWKTDRLPHWTEAAVAAHVEVNYALQERLYALALVQMLGITDEASYEARFGGTVYVFLRGLGASPDAAVRGRRPTFQDIRSWQTAVADLLADAGASTGAEDEP
jgi:exodeoxyribonuclease V beta subunit